MAQGEGGIGGQDDGGQGRSINGKGKPEENRRQAEEEIEAGDEDEDENENDDEEEYDDDEEDEPRLKYTSLTKNLRPAYRNGDSTSAFLVAGDKMVRCHERLLIQR